MTNMMYGPWYQHLVRLPQIIFWTNDEYLKWDMAWHIIDGPAAAVWKEKAAETEAAAAAAATAAYQQIDTLMMRKHHPREKFYLVLITDGTLILALIGTQLEMSDKMKLCCKTRCLNFFEILLLHITLPTWDCANDLMFASIAIHEGHYR